MRRDAAEQDSGLREALAVAAAVIEDSLEALLPPVPGGASQVVSAMRYAVLDGGKRMRGFLVMEVAAMFAVPVSNSVRVAAAVEMLHAYSLVHDDLPSMDDDDLRRGKPSTHRAFDEATAILAGDALQTRAFEILAEPETHADPGSRCMLVAGLGHAAGAEGMVGGQMYDMVSEGLSGRGEALGLDDLLHLQALKTGRLIQYSAEAGAILGRVPADLRARVAAYGRDLGAAFQIADDVLDETGTVEEIGKTVGKDVAAGKATIVGLLGLERAAARARSLAEQAVGQRDACGPEADRLRALAAYVVSRKS